MLVRMLVVLMLVFSVALAQKPTEVRPSPQQVAWQDLEIGVLIHFGLNTFSDKEWGDGKLDPRLFNPWKVNAEQWVTAAKAAGARYLILVAKHHDGFCLWPSGQTQYTVASSYWRGGKGDLVREAAEACRKHGLKFGIYLSPWDRHEPSYRDNAAYDKFYAAQLSELASGYGELTEFWLDGAGSEGHVYNFEEYIRTLRKYQPNTLVFGDVGFLKNGDLRWVGNEEGVAPEELWNVVGRQWRPAECDTPLRERHWFWHPRDEKSLKPLSKLLELYHKSVGRGAQLVLGLAPDDRGLLPESDVARLKEFGVAVAKLYADNLTRKGSFVTEAARAFDGDLDTYWPAPRNRRKAVLEVRFPEPVSFDRTVAMEWLNVGQRVQKYEVQAWEGARWKTLCQGTTIGHKKIDVFPRTSSRRVRLRILAARGAPQIREFQIYDGTR